MLSHWKMVLLITACLSVAVVLGWRSLHGSPKKEQLARVEGVIDSVLMYSPVQGTTHPLVRVRGRPEAFLYLPWFPEPERIYRELKPGDQVRLLSDTPGEHLIWEIEKDGRAITTYEQTLAAVRSNNSVDPYIALLLGLVGVAVLLELAKSVRKGI
jgi:hypothetical protein